MATITIPVDPATARAYAEAPLEDQRKMQLLLSLRLRELTATPGADLRATMGELADKAAARGLTPSVLESLLNG